MKELEMLECSSERLVLYKNEMVPMVCACVDFYANLLALGFTPPFRLELGPGKFLHTMAGTVGIGLNEKSDPGCQIMWDLNNGIPLPDGCVIWIHSNQVLEHIRRENFIHLMNEMWRVMVHGGKMLHCVPHFQSPYSIGDPTHYNQFSEATFQYFSVNPLNGLPFVEDFSDYGIESKFVLDKQEVRPAIDVQVWMSKP